MPNGFAMSASTSTSFATSEKPNRCSNKGDRTTPRAAAQLARRTDTERICPETHFMSGRPFGGGSDPSIC